MRNLVSHYSQLMKGLNILFKKIFNNLEAIICSTLLGIMLIILTAQVISRYIFNSSISWSEELARYLFIWFIFIGMSYAALKDAHIKIDSLLVVFPKAIRRYVLYLGTIVWIIFNIIILVYSFEYTKTLFVSGQKSLGTQILIGYVYVAIPTGFALTTIRLVQTLFVKKKEIETGQVEL